MTRDEHLAWCRERALEYLDTGDLTRAFTSMVSDVTKHGDCRVVLDHSVLGRGAFLAMGGDEDGLRDWIENFR